MELKIGSYNIAAMSKCGHNPTLIAGDILKQELDIVGLQEVDRLAARSRYLDMMKALSEETGYQYYYFAHAIDLPGDEATYGQKGEYGLGILSKYPIVAADHIRLNSGTREQRILAHAEIDVDGTTVHFFNTHLSYEDNAIRAAQLEVVNRHIAACEPRILTGDFNVRSLRELEALSSVRRAVNEENPLKTYLTDDWESGNLDNICFSHDFALKESHLHDQIHSDHVLLIATLTLAAEK